MKIYRLLPLFVIPFLIFACHGSDDSKAVKINADSLVVNIQKFDNSLVEIEGTAVHICGVDHKKLKLKTDGGYIVKVIFKDSTTVFDRSLYKKRVKIKGIVKEYRVEKKYIKNVEKEKTVLCHIDYTPCKDSVWVQNKVELGTAVAYSDRQTQQLEDEMKQSQKAYISVITILAEKCEVLE